MTAMIARRRRTHFPEDFKIEKWQDLEKVLKEILAEEIMSENDLIGIIEKIGELSDVLEETGAWKMIKVTQFADNAEFAKEQEEFYESVAAPSSPYFFQLEKKIVESEFFVRLSHEKYSHLGKILRNDIDLFREENIPLFVKENGLVNKYAEIYSQLTVQFEGSEKTLKEMDLILKDNDRSRREKAWRLVAGKMLEKREEFEQLFDELKNLRVQSAKNAGFENYRDYAHKAHGRFDYTPDDLYRFHESVEKIVLPVIREINEKRREKLGVDALRTWDMAVELDGKSLKPFSCVEELLSGSLHMLGRMDPEFAEVIGGMAADGYLDLSNRKGKAPGAYSCPLNRTGSSFIFMNAVGLNDDIETLLHESGHALHNFATREEKISEYKDAPSELAEVASMSMELFALDYLDEFYKDDADIKKAKREKLKDAITIFPSVAAGDAFQHWAYINPDHTAGERDEKFAELKAKFDVGVDWSGLEKERSAGWLRVPHFFESPFYYVEYAIAQLGAIALYKQLKEDPQKAFRNYKNFMRLGYAKSVPEVYAAAGIRFDFSEEYVKEMIDFIAEELEKAE